MIGESERLSADFLAWDSLGRGFRVWDRSVAPEPPYRPFAARRARAEEADDGRRPTLLSSLMRRASERLAPRRKEDPRLEEAEREPEPFERRSVAEYQAHLGDGSRIDPAAWAEVLRGLRACREPVAFELVGTEERVAAQLAFGGRDEPLVRRILGAFLPDITFRPAPGYLERAWGDAGGPRSAAVEFGLGRETAIPFAGPKGDPFVGLVAALAALEAGETAAYQVIFAPARPEWGDALVFSATHANGTPRFVNAPEIAAGARQKADQQLFAAVVRVAATTATIDRTWEVIYDAAMALSVYGTSRGNELVPLQNDGYPAGEHESDVLLRQSWRSGMLLSAAELAGFAHLPGPEVRSPRLRPKIRKTVAAPAIATGGGLELGVNSHEGAERTVALSPEQRARHALILGASGTGKSTLLFKMIMQDIERGEGVTVIEPHGDLIDRVLGAIPASRLGDVVLVDPSNEDRIVGFNILSARTDWERNMLAGDLVAIFRRLSSAWGDQLNSVLHNAILAILKSERGGTLLDLRRFLLEPAFRATVLATVDDPNVAYFWRKVFPTLPGGKSVGSVLTRLDMLLSPESIRYMLAQSESRFDVGDVMNGGKILLARLSQGAIGKDNSHLLGSLFVARIQSEAMARQRQSEASRRFHALYIDEVGDFITPSLADSFTGIRKFRTAITAAAQELRQLEKDSDVASAMLSNAYTRVVFRVGDRDARTLESGFASFEARDIQNLPNFEAICRVERADCDFSLSVPRPDEPGTEESEAWRAVVTEAAMREYGVPKADLARALARDMGADVAPTAERKPPPAKEPNQSSPAQPVAPSPRGAQPVAAPVEGRLSAGGNIPTQTRPAAPKPEAQAAPGVGGVQHRTVQSRVRAAAEALGFLVEVEKAVLGGAGQVDLALSRGGLSIACEVTVTTTVDHEVGNVAKCAQAGYRRIAVVGLSARKLAEIEEAVARSLGAEVAALVRYYLPDAFIEHLGTLPPPEPSEPEVKTVKGYKVKTTAPKLTPEEAKAKEDAALRLIADAMRRRPKKG